jgi:hypothetical protein
MSDSAPMKCLRCQGELQPLGRESLVTGGSGPAAKFFLGQMAEMQEKNWVVNAFSCANCHHVELFDAGQ